MPIRRLQPEGRLAGAAVHEAGTDKSRVESTAIAALP